MSQAPTEPVVDTPTLGQKAARGFLVNFGVLTALKVVNVLAQFILAWLLIPEDFGLFGMTTAAISIITLLRRAGLRDVLVHRGRKLDLWATSAFWLSVICGVVTSLLLVAVAPLAAWVFDEPRVVWLILIMAPVPLLDSVGTVAESYLQRDMRFGAIGKADLVSQSGINVGMILLAALGLGAYSFVLPRPLMQLVRAGMLIRAAKPPLRWKPQVRRWRYLLGDGLRMLGTEVAYVAANQFDYFMLGVFHSATTVGLYFFAFSLSMQSIRLFAKQVAGVIFPALSQIQDDVERQRQAFRRAVLGISAICMPMLMLQIATAEPLFLLVLKPKWYESIPLVQLLSAGMLLNLFSWPALSVLKAQGRFNSTLMLTLTHLALLAAFVTPAAKFGNVMHVAIAAATAWALIGPIQLHFALRQIGLGWGALLGPCVRILLSAAVAIGPAAWAATMIPLGTPGRELLRLVIVTVSMCVIYPLLIRWLQRETWGDLMQRVRQLRSRRSRRRAAAA